MQQTREQLRASVKEALVRPDESWYRNILKQDVSGCPLRSDEISGVLHGTLTAAAEVAQQMAQSFPALSPLELASVLRLNVAPMDDRAGMEPMPLLGLYQPAGRQILLHEHALAAIEAFIAENGLESLTPAKDLRACVLYHEIFHAIEDATPRIFTRSAMVQRKLFGFISWRRGLASASEIGAIHFSRLMAMTHYSPCVFGDYLLLVEGRVGLDGLSG